MMGFFIRNDLNQLCFVNMDEPGVDIIRVCYKTHERIAVIHDSQQREDMFAVEIEPEIAEAFLQQDEIMIVNMDVVNGHEAYAVPVVLD